MAKPPATLANRIAAAALTLVAVAVIVATAEGLRYTLRTYATAGGVNPSQMALLLWVGVLLALLGPPASGLAGDLVGRRLVAGAGILLLMFVTLGSVAVIAAPALASVRGLARLLWRAFPVLWVLVSLASAMLLPCLIALLSGAAGRLGLLASAAAVSLVLLNAGGRLGEVFQRTIMMQFLRPRFLAGSGLVVLVAVAGGVLLLALASALEWRRCWAPRGEDGGRSRTWGVGAALAMALVLVAGLWAQVLESSVLLSGRDLLWGAARYSELLRLQAFLIPAAALASGVGGDLLDWVGLRLTGRSLGRVAVAALGTLVAAIGVWRLSSPTPIYPVQPAYRMILVGCGALLPQGLALALRYGGERWSATVAGLFLSLMTLSEVLGMLAAETAAGLFGAERAIRAAVPAMALALALVVSLLAAELARSRHAARGERPQPAT